MNDHRILLTDLVKTGIQKVLVEFMHPDFTQLVTGIQKWK